MVFCQKVNARNVTQRPRKFHRTPAASSTLESITQQVKRIVTSKPNGSPHPPQASVIQPSRAGKPWDEDEEQLLLSMYQAGKSSQEMSDQLPGRSQRVCQIVEAQGVRPSLFSSDISEDCEDESVISNREAGKTWKRIGKLRSSRTAGAAATHRRNYPKDDSRGRIGTHKTKQHILWSPREEQLLVTLRAGRKAWDKISKRLPGRSIEACQKRYRYIRHRDGHQTSDISWTKPKVADLISLVNRIGPQWSEIAKSFPGRSPESCRLRYYKGYPPEHRNTPWTESEEVTLLSLLITLEKRWKKISKELPGRTPDACRTYYSGYEKQHGGELPEACGPSPEEWRQKWGKEFIIYRLRNELSRKTLTTINVAAAEEAQNFAQVDFTAQATNEAVNADTMDFSYPVLNTVPKLRLICKPRNGNARKGRVMDVPEV